MGNFFAATQKPTSLYSLEDLDELVNATPAPLEKRRKTDEPVTIHYEAADGSKKFQGGNGLKATQQYTPEFGAAMVCWFLVREGMLKEAGMLASFLAY